MPNAQPIADNVVRINIDKFEATSETPRANLRWKDGVLQQMWFIEHFAMGGVRLATEHEWRDVPVAAE